MATFARLIVVMLAWVMLWPPVASAGMPSVTLADLHQATQTGITDLARQRLEVISFFVLGLLACTGVIRWVWNGLRNDFPALPRMSYFRALGIIVVWGLLFVLVLTMVSGARELMTPGAWEKKGLTYRLAQSPPSPVEAEITARYEAITRLGDRLMAHAKGHDDLFPTPQQVGEFPESLWRVPSPSGGRYLYEGGHYSELGGRFSELPSPLAYEPESVGPDRLVLMTDGSIQWMPAMEIERVLSSRKP